MLTYTELSTLADMVTDGLYRKMQGQYEKQISKNEAYRRYRCRAKIDDLIYRDKVATRKVGNKTMLSVQDLERELGTIRMKKAIRDLNKKSLTKKNKTSANEPMCQYDNVPI